MAWLCIFAIPPAILLTRPRPPLPAAPALNVASAQGTPPSPAQEPPKQVPATIPETTLAVLQGEFNLDLTKVPTMGDLSAPNKVVSLFDYTCHHCRETHHFLKTALATFSNQLAVVSLPVPLDSTCNPLVKVTPPAHVNACEYARIGLAVWKADPILFRKWDDWVFEPPTPPSIPQIRAYAAELVGEDKLDAALKLPWIEEQIQTDMAIFKSNSMKAKRSQMPQLIFPKGASIGSLNDLNALMTLLDRYFGLKAK